MNMIQVIGAVEMGLIFSLVAIGVYLSFRVLQFPDLTIDGTFPLGGLVSAALIVNGFDPWFSLIVAFLAGLCAGLVTAWLATHLKILNLLAGILTMTGLYSINLRIMGRPNISIGSEATIFTQFFQEQHNYALLGMLIAVVLVIVYLFLSTRLGLGMRSIGSNARMARANGINDNNMIWLGLSLSNGLVALAGALFAQMAGAGDATCGTGTIVYGLAALILGESLLPIRTVFQCLIACVIGSILHRLVIAMALNGGDFGLVASDTQIVTAILVALVSLIPILKVQSKKDN